MTHHISVHWTGDSIATLDFSDPERQNQICWAAIDEMGEALVDAREQGARVVILASSLPGHWLEHAWLSDLSAGVEGRPQTGKGIGWFTVLEELTREEVVSIAAVSGDCAGGGAELGWACDLRIAETQARFAQPEVIMGLTTGIGGSSRLARLAGRSVAAEMVLTGQPISARRLYDVGAVNRVVDEGKAEAAAQELAAELVTRPPSALQGLKRILSFGDDAGITEALRYEQDIFQSIAAGEVALKEMKRVQAGYDRGDSLAELSKI